MQIDSLRYFVALAHAGSFYKAAKTIFISQQGLNKAVSAIESELGVKLVERTSRGIRLTSAGEVFLKHATMVLDEYSDLLIDLYAQHRAVSPDDERLVIHVTYYPAQISMPFMQTMDALGSVNIVEEPFPQLISGALASDGSELYLADLYGAEERRDSFPDLIFEPVLNSQFGVVWKEGSPLQGHYAIHREQLADYPLAVDSHREMLKLVDYVMQDYPLNNIQLAVANPRTTIKFAAKSSKAASTYDSFGFTLAQRSPTLQTDGLHFTPFSTPRSMCQVGFFYNKKMRPNTRARHAIDLLHRRVQGDFEQYFKRYPLT